MTPLQGVVSMDGTTVTSAAIPVRAFLFPLKLLIFKQCELSSK